MFKEQGSVIVESALILPVFLFIVMTFYEITIIFFYSFVLEGAMYEATREAKIAEDRSSISQLIRDKIGEKSYGIMPVDKVIISTDLAINTTIDYSNTPAEQCSNGTQCPCAPLSYDDTNNNQKCDAGPPDLELGQPGDMITYISFYKKTIFTPGITSILGFPNGEAVISSSTALRNEP
ncbi:MAG: pilus assembly protein [Rickettsiales bacterium]|nr:pilus assembly protein [Rickettsiales bacterium]